MDRARRDPVAQALSVIFCVATVALIAVVFVVPAYSVGKSVTTPDGSIVAVTTYETVLAANQDHWPLLVGLILAGIITSTLALLTAWCGSRVARLGLGSVIVALSGLTILGMASLGLYVLPAAVAGWILVARSNGPQTGVPRN